MNKIIELLILHEDTFYEYFIPYRHPKTKDDCWGGIGLETYGEDYELAKSIDDNYIWTVLEGCAGPDQWIVNGWHYVNRICYLVTEKPHNGLEVDFRCPSNYRSLTPLEIKRQIKKIERAFEKMKSPII